MFACMKNFFVLKHEEKHALKKILKVYFKYTCFSLFFLIELNL